MTNPYTQPAPPQQYAPPPQQYAPPGYPYQQPPAGPAFPYAQPQQLEVQPGAEGSLDGFQSQVSGGAAPGISWKGKPLGYSITGTLIRDLRNGDVKQDRAPANQGGALKTFKDGSPMFVLSIPLYVQPSPEFPEGEATLYVRGGLKDALDAACGGQFPGQGDELTVTLVERKDVSWATIPKNIFTVVLKRAQAPVQQAPVQQAPVQQVPVQQAPVQQAPVQQAPVQQAPVQQAPVQQASVQQAEADFMAGLTDAQRALLAQLKG